MCVAVGPTVEITATALTPRAALPIAELLLPALAGAGALLISILKGLAGGLLRLTGGPAPQGSVRPARRGPELSIGFDLVLALAPSPTAALGLSHAVGDRTHRYTAIPRPAREPLWNPGAVAPRVHSALKSCFHFLLRLSAITIHSHDNGVFSVRREDEAEAKPVLQRQEETVSICTQRRERRTTALLAIGQRTCQLGRNGTPKSAEPFTLSSCEAYPATPDALNASLF